MTFSLLEKTALAVLIAGTLGLFFWEVVKRLRIVARGTGTLPLDRISQRLIRTIQEVLFHRRVIGGRFWPGLMHGLVFWGFIVFGIITLDHFAAGFETPLLSPEQHHCYSIVVLPFSILVIIGISFLAYRRFILKPEVLGKLSPTSGIVALFISLLMVTYIYGETSPPLLLDKIQLVVARAPGTGLPYINPQIQTPPPRFCPIQHLFASV